MSVLGSSALGLPVSTSHCLVGSVVGIGIVQTVTKTGIQKFMTEHRSKHLSDRMAECRHCEHRGTFSDCARLGSDDSAGHGRSVDVLQPAI